jgi:Flp pilus assembly protein TadD
VLAEGGLLSGIPYLAFVGLVGWRLVVAVRRRRGEPWLVAGIGAGWIGYQTQSLVSIDKPSLAVLHWALAGAIVVLAGPIEAKVITLPGRERRTRQAPVGSIVGIGVVGILAVVGAWFVTQPFRADLADIAGTQAIARNDGDGALHHLERARSLAPWEAHYTFDLVLLGGRAHDAELALGAAEDGARLEPGDSSYAVTAANVADLAHRPRVARRWFDRALAVDPYGLDPLLGAAQSAAAAGEAERAHALLRRALAVSDSRADVWSRVGDVRSALREDGAARSAYRKALAILPGDPDAERGLAQLDK